MFNVVRPSLKSGIPFHATLGQFRTQALLMHILASSVKDLSRFRIMLGAIQTFLDRSYLVSGTTIVHYFNE